MTTGEHSIEQTVQRIISVNQRISEFWRESAGWAPPEAAELLEIYRLDRQASLSESLRHWTSQEFLTDGDLILAWTNLGALVEGTCKLFLAVYMTDYQKDPILHFRTKKAIEPGLLELERLRQFFTKHEILNNVWLTFVDLVQKRRNAIHATVDKEIGTTEEFFQAVGRYLQLLDHINGRIPYPDGVGRLPGLPRALGVVHA